MLELPQNFRDIIKQKAFCHIATLLPDGSPHTTMTWVDTDNTYVLINSVQTHQKVRNMQRDPRVALNVANPTNPSEVVSLRGYVAEITTEGAVEHLEALSQKYMGKSYSFGKPGQVRVIIKIAVEKFLGR